MRSASWLRLPPLKLHTRTTILTSAVLVAVFAIMAYFSNLAITHLSGQQERQDAQLLATRVADTVELHITRLKRREERRTGKKRTFQEFELTTIPDWDEVREAIEETVIKDKPQLAKVRYGLDQFLLDCGGPNSSRFLALVLVQDSGWPGPPP
jgi:hypothetical protein